MVKNWEKKTKMAKINKKLAGKMGKNGQKSTDKISKNQQENAGKINKMIKSLANPCLARWNK